MPKKKSYQFFLYINILLVVATILSGLGSIIDPRSLWIFSFFGLAFPFLVLINLCFIIWWMIKKLRYTLISIICLIVLQKQVNNSFGFNFIKDKIEHYESYSVMSYNTSNFNNGLTTKKAIKKSRKNAVKFITSSVKPDILCMQELTGINKSNLQKKLSNYYIHSIENRGALIMSKFPIIKKGQIDFSTTTNSCLWADLQINNRIVRVYSAHLQSNKISSEAKKLLSDKPDEEKKTLSRIVNILKRYKKYNVQRAQQADRIRKHINNSPHKVILCGDFNDTPQSYTYNTLKGNLTDNFLEKSGGLGVSFGGKIPGLRIDYILSDPSLTVINFDTKKVNYSDHYPVISTLKF